MRLGQAVVAPPAGSGPSTEALEEEWLAGLVVTKGGTIDQVDEEHTL